VAARAPIQCESPAGRFIDHKLLQRTVTARAEMLARAGLLDDVIVKPAQWIARMCPRDLHQMLQLAGVQPDPVTTLAVIDFNRFEAQDEQPNVALGADGNQVRSLSACMMEEPGGHVKTIWSSLTARADG